MTSRRSRLKAVTNLPVRRKTLTTPGNGHEGVAVENSTPETIYSHTAKGEESILSTSNIQQSPEKDIRDITYETDGNECSVAVNITPDYQNHENCLKKDVSNTDEQNNLKVLENINANNNKTETGNTAVFRSSKRFKPNLVSATVREKSQTLEKSEENENSVELNCITTSNNTYNSSSNNIVEDGLKCYAVLTSQNINFSSLSEYTITSLTPCSNTYIEATENEEESPQQYEGIQIYTEFEPTELYNFNQINENSESNSNCAIETQSFEPVLTNLTNCSTEHTKSVTPECTNSCYAEVQNVSEDLSTKPVTRNKTYNNVKSNSIENCDTHRNSVKQQQQATDSHVVENVVSSVSQNVSSDLSTLKQCTSTVRRRRSKYSDFTKKLADAKREFQKKYDKTKPDRSTLKMIDLIFYNPATNPMESKGKFEKKDSTTTDVISDLLNEEKVDEPESIDNSSKSNISDNCDTETMNKMPVPQVKIGVDGEIILDEKSLVIETTEAKKGREGLQNSVPIFEDREYKVSYYRGKSKKTRDWADFETKRFYKALNTIGPDFTLMQKYFPKRSRLELKNKFKREERLNRSLIDKALNNPSEFDMTQLEKDLAIEKEAEEAELEMRLRRIIKRVTKKPRIKNSYLSREIIESDDESDESLFESFDMAAAKALLEREKNKKEKEFDFVFKKLLMKEAKKPVSVLPEISSSSNGFECTDHGVT